MSTLTAIVVLVAMSALFYVLLALALGHADRRAEQARSTEVRSRMNASGLGDLVTSTVHVSGGGTRYVEVGAWSGYSYPSGAVVVGYNGKAHSRVAVVWAAQQAAGRDLPLVVLYAANYSGMTGTPGPGLHHRDPGALEAAEELTARGVAEAVAAHPALDVFGATEVTSAVRALTEASRDAALVVVGRRSRCRLARTLLGSVSSRVAARATSTVVVVTEEGAHGAPGPEHPVIVGTDGSAQAGPVVRRATDMVAAAFSGEADRGMVEQPRARTSELAQSEA